MLSPESIRQYQAESNCRAGYCLHCGTKLAMVETYVCDQCAINLYPDPNTEDEEDG